MKITKKFAGLTALLTAGLLTFTGCAGQNGAAVALGEAMNSLYYGTDSETATAMLGGTSADIRETFEASAANVLATQFQRTDPAADAEGTDAATTTVDPADLEEGTTVQVPIEAAEDETAEPEAAAEPAPLSPLFTEMGEKLIAKMQTTATYKIRLMTLKDNTAMLKVSIYGVDINDYFTKTMGILSEIGDIAALTEDEYVTRVHEKYMPLVDTLAASKEPVDLYVNMTEADGKWQIDDLQNFIAQVFQVYVGGY